MCLAAIIYGVKFFFYRPSLPAIDEGKISALQIDIDKLQESNATAKAEIEQAKRNAARERERAQMAQAKAESFSSQAAEWRERYDLAIRQRDNLKRAQSGSEAVGELRKMGWVK